MIPKIIHYAWFGNSMPNDVKIRIEEWKKFYLNGNSCICQGRF